MKFFVEVYKKNIILQKYDQEKLNDGEYQMILTKKRNIKHHRKYWLLMNALAFHFGNTSELWHIHYKAKFLPLEEFHLPSGRKILYPSSTSFEKLDQTGFDEYYKNIENYLIEQGYSIDELIETSS